MPFPHDGVGIVVVVVDENTVVVVLPAVVLVVVVGGAAVVVVAPSPQVMSPLSQAAITPFQHGSQSRPPGGPHCDSIWLRHVGGLHAGGPAMPSRALALAQVPLLHASQQLACSLAQALPPRGGLHSSALRFVLHVFLPLALVRQHATAPSPRPHVERAAQRTIWPRQLLRSWPLAIASLTTPLTQRTYCPWFVAPPQSHCTATAARTFATSEASSGWLHAPPSARAGGEAATNESEKRSEERRVGKECRSRWSPYH